jgi:hypothetical protein
VYDGLILKYAQIAWPGFVVLPSKTPVRTPACTIQDRIAAEPGRSKVKAGGAAEEICDFLDAAFVLDTRMQVVL